MAPVSSVRTVRKDLKNATAEARRLLRRARRHLSDADRRACEAALTTAREVIRAKGDAEVLTSALQALHAQVERHLAAYRRPALLEFVLSVGGALLIALTIRAFIFEAFRIPSGSMIPSLAVGDQIFVNKMLYGPRIPFTGKRLLEGAAPKYGEVVVFIYPVDPDQDFIKRVVGLAGDEVSMLDGVVHVNGEPLVQRHLGQARFWDRDGDGGPWVQFDADVIEETHGGHTYRTLREAEPARRRPDFSPLRVPEGHIFVLGDNRDRSADSRVWGFVPEGSVLGRATFVWWSWGAEGLRASRLGHPVHALSGTEVGQDRVQR